MVGRRTVSKIEAAQAQLHMAIRLFFEDADLLPVYTLAAASRQLCDDLFGRSRDFSTRGLVEGDTSGGGLNVPLSMYLDLAVAPEYKKMFRRELRKTENFL